MHKRQVLAREQAEAAYANITSGHKTLQQVLETDLMIEDWHPVFESLVFLEPNNEEIIAKQQRCVESIAAAEAKLCDESTTQTDFLQAVKDGLATQHAIFLSPAYRAIALEQFPNEVRKVKRGRSNAEEEEAAAWFLTVIDRALLKRDLKLGFEFAFPTGEISIDTLAKAYTRIGETAPSLSALQAMLRDVKQASTFNQLFTHIYTLALFRYSTSQANKRSRSWASLNEDCASAICLARSCT